jgi:hypothetical protein
MYCTLPSVDTRQRRTLCWVPSQTLDKVSVTVTSHRHDDFTLPSMFADYLIESTRQIGYLPIFSSPSRFCRVCHSIKSLPSAFMDLLSTCGFGQRKRPQDKENVSSSDHLSWFYNSFSPWPCVILKKSGWHSIDSFLFRWKQKPDHIYLSSILTWEGTAAQVKRTM